MVYPAFPFGGVGARPVFFSTFDPAYMKQANDVLANNTLQTAGPAAIYNGSAAQPPSYWTPAYVMFGYNFGRFVKTGPFLWAQRWGLSRAFYVTYAGGMDPS
jgi:hypothetical protein